MNENNNSALQSLNAAELTGVEGGVVTAAAVAGAVAIGAGAAVAVVGVGVLIGWGLYELTK